MGYRSVGVMRGIGYLLRGLRSGRMSLTLLGACMIAFRLVRAFRRTRVADFPLEKGSSVGLRLTSPGADPATFRLDAPDRG